MKKELIFLGPPACGKGTQTNRLSEYLGFPHVDTGSLLRAEIAKESEEGKIAKSFIDKGQLVPAELVGKIIAKKLAGDDCKNGYVLDGYPRSLEQARMLDEINADIDKDNEVSFKAIYFTRYRSSPSLSPGLHRIGFEAYFRTRNGFLPRGILLWEKHLTPGHRPKAVYRRGRPTALYPGLVLSHRRAGSLHRQPRQPPSCRSRYFSRLPL